MEGMVVQLQGRSKIDRRTLRGLHGGLTITTRWINDGPDIPFRVHVNRDSALVPQCLIQTLAIAGGFYRLFLSGSKHTRPCRPQDRQKDRHSL